MSPQARTPVRSADEIRDQEVLRATRELAAYFKGLRTEREARSALKIIRAFVKERERIDPAKRRPLPGLGAAAAAAPRDAPASREKRDKAGTREQKKKKKKKKASKEARRRTDARGAGSPDAMVAEPPAAEPDVES